MAQEMSRRGFFGWVAALLGLAAVAAKTGARPPGERPLQAAAGSSDSPRAGGPLTSVTDALGSVTTYVYDCRRPLRPEPGDGQVSTYVYDADGRRRWHS